MQSPQHGRVPIRGGTEECRVDITETSRRISKIVLHTHAIQVKEPSPQYSLAADTGSRQKTRTVLRTSDDKEVGTLKFDYEDSTLVFHVTGDIPFREVQKAVIQTRDGQTLTGKVSTKGKNRLILLEKQKVVPKDVSQITLTVVE